MNKKQQKKRNEIIITDTDQRRLNELLNNLEAVSGVGIDPNLKLLQKELGRAKITPPGKVPDNVITMNSQFRIRDMDSEKEFIYTLAWPEDAEIEESKISILAPVGTGLLGYRVGDIVEWPVPAGIRKFKIEEILYQPEAHSRN